MCQIYLKGQEKIPKREMKKKQKEVKITDSTFKVWQQL